MVKAASSVPRVETKLFANEVSAVRHTQHIRTYVRTYLYTQAKVPMLECTYVRTMTVLTNHVLLTQTFNMCRRVWASQT